MDSIDTSQRTLCASIKKNYLMLCRETVAVYCKNYMEHINTCVDFLTLNLVVHVFTTGL
jgi:hypothetical protein